MNTHKRSANSQACGEQVASEASTPPQPQYQQIKLALDVHAASIVVGRMMDGAKPHLPERTLGISETAFTYSLQPTVSSLFPTVSREN